MAVSEKQRRFLGAKLGEKKTGMSESQLGDFASGSGQATKKNKKTNIPPAVRKKVGGFTVGI